MKSRTNGVWCRVRDKYSTVNLDHASFESKNLEFVARSCFVAYNTKGCSVSEMF